MEGLRGALAERYVLQRELGRGGMATVYLAHDVKHDRDVAIKVLHPELAAALGGDRFLTEIKTTARLQHPHILPLLDSGSADGQLFYVMPYVKGESLRDRLARETQLPIPDAVRIAREVADALGAAHAMGIVHRDIKPENILLQGDHALVADFGIALAVQQAGGARITQTGLSLGTPQYMSPEQAMGEKTIDARADIYALGAVTYEMLSGEPPFTGANMQAIIARVMTERPPSLRAVRDTIPPGLEAAILSALARLPADRYTTVQAFSDALVSGATATGNTSAAFVAPPRTRTSVRLWQATTVVAVLLAAFALVRPRQQGVPSVLVRRQLTFDGNVIGTAISPDGLWLAYLLDDCAREELDPCTVTLKVREVDGSQSVSIATWESIDSDIRWSGDGRTLVFRGAEHGGAEYVFLSDRLGGTLRKLLVSPTAMSVMPDGTSLVIATGTSSQQWLHRYDIVTLALLDSAKLPANVMVSDLSASPVDGTLAARALIGDRLVQMLLLTPRGRLLDTATVPARNTLRWDSAGTAVLTFDDGEGGGVGDDLLRVGVVRHAFDHLTPSVLLGQVSMGGAGLFDVAHTGRTVLAIGQGQKAEWLTTVGDPNATWRVIAEPTGYLGVIAAFTPDGAGLTVSAGDNLSGNFYTYPLRGGAARALTTYRSWAPEAGKWADNPDYSPGGAHIVFNRGNGLDADVVFTDSSGGRDRIIVRNTGSQGTWTPRWLSNDQVVIFRNGQLVVVDTSGTPSDSLSIPDSLAMGGGYSNRLNVAERSVYYRSGRARAIVAADFRSHELRLVDSSALRMVPVGWTPDGALIAAGRQDRAVALYRLDAKTGARARVVTAPKDCWFFALDRTGTRAACRQGRATLDVWLAVATSR